MSAYGYSRKTTPNFDKLSKSGALFNNFYTSAHLTPISEMALHTGMYPYSTQYTKFEAPLVDKYLTIGQILKKDSYKTFALHSSPEFTHYAEVKNSFNRGFDKYDSFDQKLNILDIRKTTGIEKFVKSIEDVKGSKFFAWVTSGVVHWPFGYSSENRYSDPNYKGILKGKRLDWETFQNIYKKIYYPGKINLSQEDHQYILDMYDNGISDFDIFLGELIGTIKENSLMDKTVIVIASEHGEGLGERGYYAHYDIFDEQVHTPLLIIYPGSSESKVNSLVTSIDVLPTILQILGIGIPSQVEGKSLMPLICGTEKAVNKEIYLERNPLWEEGPLRQQTISRGFKLGENNRDIAIRNNQWKFILRFSKNALEKESWWVNLTGNKISIPEKELYNLKDDPLETKNVIKMYPQISKDLEEKLRSWDKKSSKEKIDTKEYPMIQSYF